MGTARRSGSGEKPKRKEKVVLDTEPAEELLLLLEDRPGRANEGLLDEARDSLLDPVSRVPTADQHRVAQGEAVAFEVKEPELDQLVDVIESDVVTRPRLVERLQRRLRSKLDRARDRRRTR